MSSIIDAVFGDGPTSSTTVVNSTPGMSQEEKDLIALNTKLAQQQLANVESLQPFQQRLISHSMAELDRSGQERDAVNAILSPEDQARMIKSDFERSQRLGPISDEIMSLQLQQLRQGGRATPEQLADIKAATDAGISAGSADIDLSTSRGISLIADELANSRGLRLTDTPIAREATLLTRAGEDQKAGLIKTMRANEANARLNFPLAAAGVTSGINLNTQQIAENARQFQADLRQRAQMNRLALSGQTSSAGIGLATAGDFGRGALSNLTTGRLANSTRSGEGWSAESQLDVTGRLASGIGAAMTAFSDPDLKVDYGTVGETSDGIGLHLYHYKGEPKSNPVRMGVMADEVEKVKPWAVRRHISGYRVVDYARVFDGERTRKGIGL